MNTKPVLAMEIRSRENAAVNGKSELQAKSDHLRAAMVDECLKDAHIVSRQNPKNMAQSERRQKLLSMIVNNGEKAGGWSGAVTTMTISIENLSSCRLAEPIPISPLPVIDVVPETNGVHLNGEVGSDAPVQERS